MGKDSPKQPNIDELIQRQMDTNRINFQGPTGSTTFFGPGYSANPRATKDIQAEIDLINKRGGYLTHNREGSSPQRSSDMARIAALQEEMRLSQGGKPASSAATVVQQLTPAQQKLFDQQQQAQTLLGQRGIELAQQFSTAPAAQFQPSIRETFARFDPTFSGPQAAFQPSIRETTARFDPTFSGPQAAFNPGDFEASRSAAERAVFDRSMSLLRPEFERQDEALRQRLANQGLPQASGAFNAEMGRFETGQREAMDRLAQSAVLQGLQAQQQGFGQALDTYGAEQQRRAQQFQQDLGGYQSELARRQQQFGQDLSTYQTEAARRAQQFGQDLGAYQAEAQRRQQQFGQDIAGFQANQGQRAGQLQEILGLFGLQPVSLPSVMPTSPVQVPVPAPQQNGPNPLAMGLLGLGGAAIGGFTGGLPGASLGYNLGTGAGMMF